MSPLSSPQPTLLRRNGHDRLPFVRMDNSDPALFEDLMAGLRRVAAKAAFTLGEEVEAFEEEFARYCGVAEAVGVSSGTEAIVLALRALDVGPGDEVVLPANTFIATAEAVSLVGAAPVLTDVDPGSGLLTAAIVERALTPRTRCVIPVHLHGATVDLDPIVALARRFGVAVIEDACQAHGACIGSRRVGTIGDIGCFSFYPTKNLGGWGDGGAVVTSNPVLARRMRLLRSHGEAPGARNRHEVAGTTARLDAIQAALLRIKLRSLDERNEARRSLARRLTDRLADTPLELPKVPADDHVFHLYVVRSDSRDELRERLTAQGVASAVHYPVPIHLTDAYAHVGLGRGTLPAVERLAGRICSLPFWPSMDDSELARLAEAVAGSTAGVRTARRSGAT